MTGTPGAGRRGTPAASISGPQERKLGGANANYPKCASLQVCGTAFGRKLCRGRSQRHAVVLASTSGLERTGDGICPAQCTGLTRRPIGEEP